MTVRGFKEDTRRDYVRNVRAFAAFISRSPDTATGGGSRLSNQLHQTQSGMQPPSINSAVSALRFSSTVTVDPPDLARRLTVVPQPRGIPVVLSVERRTLPLQAASAPKEEARRCDPATCTAPGFARLEVVALQVGHIDFERMLLRVERGKGGKDRHAMLSPQLLELLRAWWREGRRRSLLLPGGWLFPGRNPVEPLSARQLGRDCQVFCVRRRRETLYVVEGITRYGVSDQGRSHRGTVAGLPHAGGFAGRRGAV